MPPVRLRAALAASLLLPATQAGAQCELQELSGDSGATPLTYVRVLDLEGDRAAYGLPTDGEAGQQAGAVLVFERVGSTWTQTARLTASDASSFDEFGTTLSLRGDRMLVGARNVGNAGSGGLDGLGAVYLLEYAGGTWRERERWVASDGKPGDLFGWNVALADDAAIVARSGGAYVFEEGPEGWSESLSLSVTPSLALFDVDVDGDVAVLGESGSIFGVGQVRVLERGPGGFAEAALLSTGVAGDGFASVLALAGETLAIGASFAFSPCGFPLGCAHGRVYVHERQGGSWGRTAELAPDALDDGHAFGRTLDVDGDRILATSLAGGVVKPGTGAAFLFDRAEGGWELRADLVGLNGIGGGFVELSGSRALMGSRAWELDPAGCPDLVGGPVLVSLSEGGMQVLQLSAGVEHAGRVHLLLGSASGTRPATPVGGVLLPLALDTYLQATFLMPNQPPFGNTLGLLGPGGHATAWFRLPPESPPSLAGQILFHAYLVLDLSSGGVEVVDASIAVGLGLIP
jgi:hypothetical protein